MDFENRTIELLAPAGSYDALCAVTEAGCDAVYIGGQRFGARAYADNPDTELLLRGIDYAHLRGVKVYLTVNTLLKEAELAELKEYLRPMYEEGLDAVIVQDFGVMQRIAEDFPDLPIHASTQMTIVNGSATELLPSQVNRIVPARELSIDEIAQLRRDTDREIEIFVHGALCYCYSGQCLLSSIAGGRSGNRGRCAQPCRKMYRFEEEGRKARTAEGYILSPKDQCLLPWLHELLDTGIDSLKIEGRMKRPEYAAGVTGIYRRWLDRYLELGSAGYRQYLAEHDESMAQDVRLLAELYNRGGFCGGYAFDTKGRGMICADRPNHTGVRVGRATVTGGDRPSAKMQLTEEIGPEEVLEFRSDEGIVYGEITTPKDMTRFDPDKPVMLRRDASGGRLPHRLSVFRMKQEALLADIRETFLKNREAIPVCGTFYAAPGEPMRLTVTDEQERVCVTVTGAIPEAARQNPMCPEQFTEKLRKTGGSGYTWTSLSAEVKDGLFVPVSAINELRREALAAYEEAVLTRGFRHLDVPGENDPKAHDGNRTISDTKDLRKNPETEIPAAKPEAAADDGSGSVGPRCAVSVMTPEQTEAAMRSSCVTDLLIDMEGDYPSCLQIVRAEKDYGAAGKKILLAMPRAVKGERREQMLRETDRILSEGFVGGIAVRTVDQLAEAVKRRHRDPSLTVYADSTLYAANESAAAWLAEQGCDAVTLSPELKRSEITKEMARGAWITVYERLPLMISEQCPVRTMFGCPGDGSNPTGTLTDGEGNVMPVRSICRYCHSVIFNADVTSLLGIFGEVLQKQPFGVRVSFTTESRKDAGKILKTLAEALRGIETADPEFDSRCTRGHWKRGVL